MAHPFGVAPILPIDLNAKNCTLVVSPPMKLPGPGPTITPYFAPAQISSDTNCDGALVLHMTTRLGLSLEFRLVDPKFRIPGGLGLVDTEINHDSK